MTDHCHDYRCHSAKSLIRPVSGVSAGDQVQTGLPSQWLDNGYRLKNQQLNDTVIKIYPTTKLMRSPDP